MNPPFTPIPRLHRSVRFSAGHRYYRDDWTAERNREAFGRSAHAHGHNYRLEVAVTGPLDPETGFVVSLTELDTLLREEVVERLDQRSLNEVVPPLTGDPVWVPSTENLARWIWERLAMRIPGEARLVWLRLEEMDDLAVELSEP